LATQGTVQIVVAPRGRICALNVRPEQKQTHAKTRRRQGGWDLRDETVIDAALKDHRTLVPRGCAGIYQARAVNRWEQPVFSTLRCAKAVSTLRPQPNFCLLGPNLKNRLHVVALDGIRQEILDIARASSATPMVRRSTATLPCKVPDRHTYDVALTPQPQQLVMTRRCSPHSITRWPRSTRRGKARRSEPLNVEQRT
jgi:hypothetical protein